MTGEGDTAELDHVPAPPQNGGGPESPLSALRSRRKQIHRDTTTEIPIPGFGGELVARYRVLPFEEVNQIERKNIRLHQDPAEREINTYADELIAACVEILVRQDGELIPASDDDRPVTYTDPRLADGLGFSVGDPPSARGALFGLFEYGNGPARAHWAVSDHQTELFMWMRGAPEDPEDEGAQGQAEETYRGE
jgi:hypothetical protein